MVYNVLLADGKKDSIFNQLKTMMDTGDTPNIVILDIPRDNAEYLQYGTLEQLKNGQVYSGKYVGGKYIYNSPHMFIFTSFEVKRELWTKDRIKLINIKTGHITSLNEQGEFQYQPDQDIVKIAVIERHHNTGNVAVALLRGYGIQSGAMALSIAHDSHNIITVGTNDEDMAFAVEHLVKQGGGIILVQNRSVINYMPMVVGGIMSDQTGEWVNEKLIGIHQDAYNQLGIHKEVEPVMTLCFMSLAVIPEIKITDMGLFDVTKFCFIPIEAENL